MLSSSPPSSVSSLARSQRYDASATLTYVGREVVKWVYDLAAAQPIHISLLAYLKICVREELGDRAHLACGRPAALDHNADSSAVFGDYIEHLVARAYVVYSCNYTVCGKFHGSSPFKKIYSLLIFIVVSTSRFFGKR